VSECRGTAHFRDGDAPVRAPGVSEPSFLSHKKPRCRRFYWPELRGTHGAQYQRAHTSNDHLFLVPRFGIPPGTMCGLRLPITGDISRLRCNPAPERSEIETVANPGMRSNRTGCILWRSGRSWVDGNKRPHRAVKSLYCVWRALAKLLGSLPLSLDYLVLNLLDRTQIEIHALGILPDNQGLVT
jgi:hypothetical protein